MPSLTLDNDPRDLVLEGGERVRLEARRRVLVYAFDDSVLEVTDVQVREREARVPARGWGRPAFA